MYSYEEAKTATLEYFGGDTLATDVFLKKYALRDNEDNLLEKTPENMHRRMAKEFARIESKYPNPMSEEEIFGLLDKFKYIIPQGSPMFGIGNNFQYASLANCFVVDAPADSYASIMRADEELVQISKRRGGVGIDISNIRPNGSQTKNAAKTSTGIIPFAERFSNSIREVGQQNRRGALMITLSVHHPEVIDFIKSKSELNKITGANISVRITDEFMEAVKTNKEYEQRFPVDSPNPKIIKKVKAQDVWEEISKNAWANAEPGLLMWDTIIRESPADCYDNYKTQATNPSLKGDTLVLTDEGVFPIQYLAENKPLIKVMNLRKEWQDATVFCSGNDKQLVEMTFTNGQSIYCTKEHKFPILNKNGDILSQIDGSVIKKPSIEIKSGDKIYFPFLDNPINNKNCKFNNEDGFVLGWNLGDGWISYHSNEKVKANQYGFIFSKEDIDSGIGESILAYTNNLAKVKSTLTQDHKSQAYKFVTTDKNVNKKMQELKACNKKDGIPKSIWEGNSEFIKGFIDGLFSADGYIDNKKNRIILVSAHEKLVKDIQKLLCFYGIKSNLRHSSGKSKFPKYNSDKIYHRYDLKISGLNVVKFATIFNLTNVKKQSKLYDIINSDIQDYYKNTREYLIVKSIKETDKYEDVYDITVDDDTHTFIMESGLTGNCGEIPLSAYDSCRLMVVNLYSFVENPFTPNAIFNGVLFNNTAWKMQRLMDDMVDLEIECIDKIIDKVNKDPEDDFTKSRELNLWTKIRTACVNGRRTGSGIVGLGDCLAALGIKYGTKDAQYFAQGMYRDFKLACYESSCKMAIERGVFPDYNADLESNCDFINRFYDDYRGLFKALKEHGRRNISLLTIAPTGTVSLVAGVTSGIEPAIWLEYTRRRKINPHETDVPVDFVDQSGDKWTNYKVFHPKLKEWSEITGETDVTKSPWFGATSEDIDPIEKVKMQAAIQKHCDHSISVTTNLPNTATVEDVQNIYMESWKLGCKGVTVYRDGSRTGVLIKNEEKFKKHDAPKRPESLEGRLHDITYKGSIYTVIVGLYESNPYEVFIIPFDEKLQKTSGNIVKHARGKYFFKSENINYNITGHTLGEDMDAITRLISTSLRHGADIQFIVTQLERTKGDLASFCKVLSRVLKKYIPDQTKVSGAECESCGGELVRNDGCISCKNCGWTKC